MGWAGTAARLGAVTRLLRGGHSAAPRRRGLDPDACAPRAEAFGRRVRGGELKAFPDFGSHRPGGARTTKPPSTPSTFADSEMVPRDSRKGRVYKGSELESRTRAAEEDRTDSGLRGSWDSRAFDLPGYCASQSGLGDGRKTLGERGYVVHLSLMPLNTAVC